MLKKRKIELGFLALLCWVFFFPTAAADEMATAHQARLRTMNQAEFESYHRQLDLDVKGVTSIKPKPDSATGAQTPLASGENRTDRVDVAPPEGGYGKGYGARTGSGNNTGVAGGLRGSSMSRGGGRNR